MKQRALQKGEVSGWIKRFIALWVLLILCAAIPLGPMTMFMGAGAVTVTATILASIVTDWNPRTQWKPLTVLYIVLIGAEVLLLLSL
ncbi:MAG: hypothetical protein VW771_11615 [Gammaproteobacteria bacterium]